MKTIHYLPYGLTTYQKGNKVKVVNTEYDDRFDLPSPGTILAQQFKQQLKNLH